MKYSLSAAKQDDNRVVKSGGVSYSPLIMFTPFCKFTRSSVDPTVVVYQPPIQWSPYDLWPPPLVHVDLHTTTWGPTTFSIPLSKDTLSSLTEAHLSVCQVLVSSFPLRFYTGVHPLGKFRLIGGS